MKLLAFSVLDKAVGAFNKPFFVRAKAEAVRSFMDACQDEKMEFHRHATDYVLMFVGEYDDSTGLMSGVEPERVISAIECLAAPDAQEGGRSVRGQAL